MVFSPWTRVCVRPHLLLVQYRSSTWRWYRNLFIMSLRFFPSMWIQVFPVSFLIFKIEHYQILSNIRTWFISLALVSSWLCRVKPSCGGSRTVRTMVQVFLILTLPVVYCVKGPLWSSSSWSFSVVLAARTNPIHRLPRLPLHTDVYHSTNLGILGESQSFVRLVFTLVPPGLSSLFRTLDSQSLSLLIHLHFLILLGF